MGNKASKVTAVTPARTRRIDALSLMNASKAERLNIIKRRMSSDTSNRKPRTFIRPPKEVQILGPPKPMAVSEEKLFPKEVHSYEYSKALNKLTREESWWGKYQHNPVEPPFDGFKPGYVMDLETCYTNDAGYNINKMKSYIMQIGACPIGKAGENFDICCLLPERSTLDHSLIICPTSWDQFKATLNRLEQTPASTVGGYKKCVGQHGKSNEWFVDCYKASWHFWRENKITTFKNPVVEINKWKSKYDKPYPLLFPIEESLKFFIEYCKDAPVWYAHNGHGFDYIIMEKWFRVFGLQRTLSCQVYKPRTTTAMQYLRNRPKGPNYDCYDQHNRNIGKAPWPRTGSIIKGYDTMKMFKYHALSRYNTKNKAGAPRKSQGTGKRTIVQTELGGPSKTVYNWADGSKSSTAFSYKQQDLIEEEGMRGNDPSAHTALADCLTLRELIYRIFDSRVRDISNTDERLYMMEVLRDARKEGLKRCPRSDEEALIKTLRELGIN